MGNIKSFSELDLSDFLEKIKIEFESNNIKNSFSTFSSLDKTQADSIVWSKSTNIDLDNLKCSIIIVPMGFTKQSSSVSIFKVPDPRIAFSKILDHFFNDETKLTGIDELSKIHDGAAYGDDFYLGEFSSIGKNCTIGNNVKIFSNVTIYPNTIIGDNVTIHSGCVIGSPGFGYVRNKENELEHFVQLGNVIIEDDVEIGANTCIDRATMNSTIVGKNTKISNFCQIAHNVIIGKRCLITGKVQIGGGTVVGDDVYIGPSTVIMNKLVIASNADIKLGSVVVKNVNEGQSVSGNFAYDHNKRIRDFAKTQLPKRSSP